MVLHCPCRLTICKIEACLFCWELFQLVSSCYSGDNGSCRLYSMGEVLWIGWLLVSWVSCRCLRYVYVEADVPELFLVMRSANMAKYGSLSSSLNIRRVFLMIWIALSTNPLLWGKSGLEVLWMKSYDLEDFLNTCELYCGPLSLNTTLGMICRANILLTWVMTVSDEAFGSWVVYNNEIWFAKLYYVFISKSRQ